MKVAKVLEVEAFEAGFPTSIITPALFDMLPLTLNQESCS